MVVSIPSPIRFEDSSLSNLFICGQTKFESESRLIDGCSSFEIDVGWGGSFSLSLIDFSGEARRFVG